MGRPALFLDRDGVINEYEPYVHRREQFRFNDGIFELVDAAQRAGFLTVVVTNQSAIGRGLCTEEDFWNLTGWMIDRFTERGCRIDRVYFCPTHPEHGIGRYRVDSEMRKPAPGMLLQAARDLDIDLAISVLVGDMPSDMEAGLAAGVGTNFFLGDQGDTVGRGCRAVRRLRDIVPYFLAADAAHGAAPAAG